MGIRWALLGLLCYLFQFSDGSSGDKSVWYWECTNECIKKYGCSKEFGTFDWIRGDCFWCRHDCMWYTVDHFESSYGVTPQFHGKWPFFAIPLPAGFVIQEPASMLFSIFNLLSVFVMLQRFKRIRNLPSRTMWIVYAHVGLVTWFSSTVFHMFDCDFTERLDYFGAFAFVLSALYVSIIFTLPQLEFTSSGRLFRKIAPFFFVVFFFNHLKNMMQHFDYGYNMKLCIYSSIATTFSYFYYLGKSYKLNGELQQADILLIRLLVWANLATALELLDFSPVFWIFDSHSLFHLATVPIPIWWAQFLEETYQPVIPQRSDYKLA